MKLSCVACRQKKIRCDRETPCGNCQRTGSHCEPQVRAKTIRRSRKTDESLLQRLRQLETIVSKLDNGQGHDLPVSVVSDTRSASNTSTSASTSPQLPSVSRIASIGRPEDGRLISKNGQTTYHPEGFWMTLTKQIAEQVSEVLDENDLEEDDFEDDSIPDTSKDAGARGQVDFVLGFTSDAMTLRLLHPSPEHLKQIWATYLERCKPVLKTVYIPYGVELIRRAMTDLASLNHVEEAWLFGLYYMVVISMKPDQCLERLGIDRETALERFRWASEQSLARAGFLLTQDLHLLEAFSMYCIALSRHIDNFTVRAMINLLVNVAHQMGLHRDGEQFNLPPYEVEWRRKLWWTIRTVDLRSSLDYDAQSLLTGRWSDTKFPTNLKDEDIWPGMTTIPQPRDEVTDISFSLLRWELTDAMIEIGKIGQMPSEQRLRAIAPMNTKLAELGTHIAQKYLRGMRGDDFENKVIEWTSVRLTKLLMARLWLIVNQPLINLAIKNDENPELQEQAYRRACIVLIASEEAEKAISGIPWGWLIKRMIDWHSVYIVVTVLSRGFNDQDEMWDIVERAFIRWSGNRTDSVPQLQKPLKRMHNKAVSDRRKRLNLQQATSVESRNQEFNLTNILPASSEATGPFSQPLNQEFAAIQIPADDLSRFDSPDGAEIESFSGFQDFDFSNFPSLEQFDIYQTAGTYNDAVPGWENWADMAMTSGEARLSGNDEF